MKNFNAYERIAQLVPVRFRAAFTRELAYSDVSVPVMKFIGFVVSFSLALGFAVAFNLWVFFDLPFLPVWLAGFVLFVTSVYLWLSLSA
ncbi:MAG: hypothetical protein GOV15_02085, partial [Candidatus Diapherotrites archaeon]|nr:hypothetical protein [Candidatus Diapherotrites archaeon]